MTTNDKALKRVKKVKPPSRPQRWAEAAAGLKAAAAKLDEAFSDVETALSAMQGVKSEYDEWLGNLPESLQSSPLGEKLQAISDLDFEQDPHDLSVDDLTSLADEAEAVDLPRGFGRD